VPRTFLPAKGNGHGHRAEALIDDDGGRPNYQVRARVVFTKTGNELLRLMLWADGLGHGDLVLTAAGDIAALDVAGRQIDSWAAAHAVLARKGYELEDGERAFRTLFSPFWSQQNGVRRSARIFDAYEEEDAGWQVSAKAFTDGASDAELVQVRIWTREQGWIQLLLSPVMDIVAHTVAATEKDAWKAALAVARRKGYELDL
jgi:hypothetical protein